MVTFHGKHLDKLLERIGLVTRKRFKAEIAKYKGDASSKEEELKKIKETMAVFLPLGLETRTSNTVSNIYHYMGLYRCFKDNPAKLAEYHEKLKIQLKSLFMDSEIKKRFGYKYRGHEKLIYSLDEVREDLQLEEIILLMQYKSEKEAEIPLIIYEKTERDRIEQEEKTEKNGKKKSSPSVPKMPKTIQINEFNIMQEVIGHDAFTLLMEKIPESQLPEEYKKKLEGLIVKKHLNDSAYFITEHFGFELEPSQCEQKLLDTFRTYEALAPSEEKRIREIGRLLDSISRYAFPDVTLWNTKLLSGTERSLLERACSEEEVIEFMNKGLIHYDKNNLKKQTFLFDDFIQITDSQAMHLAENKKQELLQYLIGLLSPDVKEAGQNTRFLPLWRFYRNLRSYYWQDAGKLPGQKQEGMQNYLRKSYIGAHVQVHECFPPEKELISVNLKKLKELVLKMQPAQ